MARVGIVAATLSGLSFAELQELARAAESAGIDAIFSPEFMNDGLANCQVMAQATSRIKVGTGIANIYLRHPALCAGTAVTIDDTSKGRLILGLGVSHRPIVEGVYKEKMERPRNFLRDYVTTVRNVVTGKGYPEAPMQPRAATYGVPIYLAALALGTVELAGELADGVMLYLCPKSRMPKVQAALEKGAAKARRNTSAVEVTTGLPTCISDDLNAAREAAKKNLAFYGGLPVYNQLVHNNRLVQGAAGPGTGEEHGLDDNIGDEP